jgi:hypothetical protein
MIITDIRPSEGTASLLREMSQEGKRDSAKVLVKHRKKDGSVIDVEKYALRSALQRMYRRQRGRRRCDRTLFWPNGRFFTIK